MHPPYRLRAPATMVASVGPGVCSFERSPKQVFDSSFTFLSRLFLCRPSVSTTRSSSHGASTLASDVDEMSVAIFCVRLDIVRDGGF